MKIKHLLENQINAAYYGYLYVYVTEFTDPLDDLNAKLYDAYLTAGVEDFDPIGPDDYQDIEFPISIEPVGNLRVAIKRTIGLYNVLDSIGGIDRVDLGFQKVYSDGNTDLLTLESGDLREFLHMNYTTEEQLLSIVNNRK